ncbi:MAG: hypothetical protein ACI9LV_000522 [Candidatus Nanohaloarchaea archaeon]|jgi:hypothetical protein
MNTKTTSIALLAALFIGAAAAQTTSTGPTANLETTLVSTDPVPLQSGEDGDLNFKIRNTGNTEASDVKVQLVDSFPFSVKPDRKKNYSLGDIAPGEEYHISTEVMTAEDAPDGSNSFKVKIIHGDFTVTKNVPVEVQSKNINLNLANLQTQPSELMPDTDSNQLSVDVVNSGDKTAENVVLDLELPEFFERTSSFSTRQALGSIQPGEVKTANFNFDISDSAPKGEVTVNGEITYSAGDSSEITEETSFGLFMAGKPQYSVEVAESSLEAGSTGELRLKVENTGEEKSSSTRIRVLDSSDQPFSYDSASKYIGSLEPGQSGEAVFEVETDSGASAKDYLLDFETRGTKGTEVFVEDETLKVSVAESSSSDSNLSVYIAVLLVIALATAFYFRNRIRNLLE